MKIMMEIANREELIHLIEYVTETGDKRTEYSSIEDFILDEIKIIKEYLKNKKPLENDEFILSSRAEHCMKEFYSYLNDGNYQMCFYDLFEFIESDKKKIYYSIIDRNKGYQYCELITSKELSVISNMIKELEYKLTQ